MKRFLPTLLLLGVFAFPLGAQTVEEESYRGTLPSLKDAPGPFPPVSAELLNKPSAPQSQATPEPGTVLLIAQLVLLGGGALFWRRCAGSRSKSE